MGWSYSDAKAVLKCTSIQFYLDNIWRIVPGVKMLMHVACWDETSQSYTGKCASHFDYLHTCYLHTCIHFICLVPRTRRNINFKCAILNELEVFQKHHIPGAQARLAEYHPGVTESDISRWKQQKDTLFRAQSLGQGQKRYIQSFTRVWYPEEEDELYIRFIYRREVRGLPVSD